MAKLNNTSYNESNFFRGKLPLYRGKFEGRVTYPSPLLWTFISLFEEYTIVFREISLYFLIIPMRPSP